MANDDVRPTVRVRDHLRRILNRHTTPTATALTEPIAGAGFQEIAVEVERDENELRDATRASDQTAIAMCARSSSASAGRSSMTVFDPTTGQTITIEPEPCIRT